MKYATVIMSGGDFRDNFMLNNVRIKPPPNFKTNLLKNKQECEEIIKELNEEERVAKEKALREHREYFPNPFKNAERYRKNIEKINEDLNNGMFLDDSQLTVNDNKDIEEMKKEFNDTRRALIRTCRHHLITHRINGVFVKIIETDEIKLEEEFCKVMASFVGSHMWVIFQVLHPYIFTFDVTKGIDDAIYYKRVYTLDYFAQDTIVPNFEDDPRYEREIQVYPSIFIGGNFSKFICKFILFIIIISIVSIIVIICKTHQKRSNIIQVYPN